MDFDTLLIIVVLGAICAFYYFVIMAGRKNAYKKVADELRASYISQGFFSIGKIVGTIQDKEYVIQNHTTGGSGKSTFWTAISLRCDNQGIPLVILQSFFTGYPNWKAIFTKGKSEMRVFFTSIKSENADVPLDEKYHEPVHYRLQEVSRMYNDDLKKGDIEITKTSVDFTVCGLVKDSEKIKKVLGLLHSIACTIEDDPIQ